MPNFLLDRRIERLMQIYRSLCWVYNISPNRKENSQCSMKWEINELQVIDSGKKPSDVNMVPLRKSGNVDGLQHRQ